MPQLTLDITMSLDGFVAGPDPTLEEPLGKDGERLHEWVVRLASWRAYHGLEGGETDADDELAEAGGCSAAAPGAGSRIRRPTAGGATTRLSTTRCSCSRTTRESSSPSAPQPSPS
jgi:hypothetical protein